MLNNIVRASLGKKLAGLHTNLPVSICIGKDINFRKWISLPMLADFNNYHPNIKVRGYSINLSNNCQTERRFVPAGELFRLRLVKPALSKSFKGRQYFFPYGKIPLYRL